MARSLLRHYKPFLFKGLHSAKVISFCAITVLFINHEVCQAEMPAASGNFKDPNAVQRVLSGKETVANAAWWGFNKEDSTAALQAAINSGAKKVIVPFMGSAWIVKPIKLASNQEILLEPGVVVMAKEGQFKGKFDCLFEAFVKNNITLKGYGATLRMRKKDYASTSYTKAEWRHTLGLFGCSNITVEGLTLRDSGGDGIYVGGDREDPAPPPSRNIRILNCVCDNNYRQGISVTAVDTLRVDNCILRNTGGTPPSAGIDLEPCNARQMLTNVVVSNCIAENNIGMGFVTNISNLSGKSREVSVLFVNCLARNNTGAGLWIRAVKDNGTKGLVEYRNCTCDNITYHGAWVDWEKISSPIRLRFVDCRFKNVAKYANYISPIELILERQKPGNQIGHIEFVNCYLYDERIRPSVEISDVENSKFRWRPSRKITDFGAGGGIYDVKGQINVFNSHIHSRREKIDSGAIGKKSSLRVSYFEKQE